MSEDVATDPSLPGDSSSSSKKRVRKQPHSDPRYPRKRSSKACHVCRGRKTKCDNAQPTCGFCKALDIPCSYDSEDRDHSSWVPPFGRIRVTVDG